jgi:hypothetical protein
MSCTSGTVEIEGHKLSAWYWVVIHGKYHSSDVEAEIDGE